MLKKALLIGAFAIIGIWALVLRCWDLGGPSLWIDEAYTITGSRSVLQHGVPMLASGELYLNGGPLAVYAAAASMSVFGFDPFNPWSARLPFILFGGAAVIAIFLFAKKVFKNEYLALAVAFITAFSYWEIAWSRQARGYSMAVVFIIFALLYAWKFLEKRDHATAIRGIVFFVLACLSHWMAVIFVPGFLAIVVARLGTDRRHSRDAIVPDKVLLFSFAGVFLAEAVVFLVITCISSQGDAIVGYVRALFVPGIGELTVFAILAIPVGLLARQTRTQTIVLSSTWIVAFTNIAFWDRTLQSRYIFLVVPLLIICMVLMIFRAVDMAVPGSSTRKHVIALVIAGVVSIPCLVFVPGSFYALEWDSPQPDFGSAFTIIKNTMKPGDVIISPYTSLSPIYLGKQGLWLTSWVAPGNPNESRLSRGLETDYYTGAQKVTDLEHILRTQHGFVVLSHTWKVDLDVMKNFISKGELQLVARIPSPSTKNNVVWLYSF